MTKTIQLINNKGEVLVDDDDFEKVNAFRWYSNQPKTSKIKYAINHYNGGMRMHRFILNAPSKLTVDHINGNGLDNRKENLRLATHSQNHGNTRRIWATSGFKGVTFSDNHRLKKWVAQIRFKNKTMNIGYFFTKEEAAHAYDKKARELFVDFAYTNF